jgi:S-adenosylmethionine synthetase
MRLALEAAAIDPERRSLEVVERKGAGHPDTLCDAAAEAFSRRLCRAYLEASGRVLHHNVDKALLVAGRTRVHFGGGEWLDPITLTLAGRATREYDGQRFAVDEIGRAAALEALGAVRHLDPGSPVQVRVRVAARPGAPELRAVFDAAAHGAPRSNDTSIGVGFAPPSRAERLALAVDARLASELRADPRLAVGEDIKVMVVREGAELGLTVAAALLAPGLSGEAAYREAVERVRAAALDEAARAGFARADVRVNAADAPGSLYLTLSGTSAECGDDGQVGRGNRACGLITPMRPMTLEAYAGKNPATHVGKLLSVAAGRVAEACARLDGVRSADCVLVSRIGAPVSEPQAAGVRLDASAGRVRELRSAVEAALAEQCAALPDLWREIVGVPAAG